MLTQPLIHMLGIALVISALGFIRVVWFVSIGYTFSIVVMCAVATATHARALDVFTVGQNVALALWGLRLGYYIVRREFSPSYQREMASVRQRSAGVGLGRSVLIWLGVSILYVCMFAPSLFSLTNAAARRPSALPMQIVGLTVLVAGLVIESLADHQKAVFKAEFPDRYCDRGLYQWVRCPNYWGEIMVWLGSWLMGMPFYLTAFQWVASGIGLLCIVLIMMGSTKRLENAQDVRYGDRSEYQAYIRRVPVLFPWVPVYSLKNVRVYIE